MQLVYLYHPPYKEEYCHRGKNFTSVVCCLFVCLLLCGCWVCLNLLYPLLFNLHGAWELKPGSSRPVAWMNEVVYLQQIIELYFFSSFPSSLSSLDTHESICRKKTTGIVLWNQHVTQQGAAGRSRMWLGVDLSHHSHLFRILRFGPKISSPNRHTCVFLLEQFFSETFFFARTITIVPATQKLFQNKKNSYWSCMMIWLSVTHVTRNLCDPTARYL